MTMDVPERREFFYNPIWLIFAGGLLFLAGAVFMFGTPVHSPGEKEAEYGWILQLVISLWFGGYGLVALSRGFDRRPVVVVDSEGLFYRPYGASIIPWRDIRSVEWIEESKGGMGDGDVSNLPNHHILVTTRDSPHLVLIKLDYLPSFPVYTAIIQAWKRHGGTA